jgi:hypothetical protein
MLILVEDFYKEIAPPERVDGLYIGTNKNARIFLRLGDSISESHTILAVILVAVIGAGGGKTGWQPRQSLSTSYKGKTPGLWIIEPDVFLGPFSIG